MTPFPKWARRTLIAVVIALSALSFAEQPNTTAEPPATQPPPPGAGRTPWQFQPDGTTAVDFAIPIANEIVRMRTHFTVPPTPSRLGTLFLWPGLEPAPGGRDYDPIGLGVLQPVLTWGDSCAPTTQPSTYSTWWISGQYVNVGDQPDYQGCHSGPAMSPRVGEVLDIDIALDQSSGVWTQTVTGRSGSVRYAINMGNQAQNRAIFAVEPWDNAQFAGPLLFSDTTLTFRDQDPRACTDPDVSYSGTGGAISRPTSADGRVCHIDTVTVNGTANPAHKPGGRQGL
ncbi:hypothetical protein [Nocardia sp. NPDC051570]|uniref:hypothetical protein n=1 Tax=Nocardia sp. NPDC051570 TaxID=3364324 RepID=UPI00378A1726